MPGKGPGEKKALEQQEVEYIPTLERLKIEPIDESEEDRREARAQNKLAWMMIGALVGVTALVGINMALTPPEAEEEEQVAQTEDTSGGSSDSTAHSDTSSTGGGATPPEPTTPPPSAARPPAPTTPPPAATAATTPPPEPAPAATPYGIVVGTYLNETRANEEATKLKGTTSLDAKIESFDDGGVPSYRVVLGSFPNRKAAEKKANDLIGQDLVYEARVTAIK
jgi:cell division protein FtsN